MTDSRQVDQQQPLLYIPDIMRITGMPEETIRSRYHAGTMECLWKLGRRLVARPEDLEAWLRRQQEATTKVRSGSAPTTIAQSSHEEAK